MKLTFWEVEAEQFLGEMTTGRTKPAMCRCVGRQVTADESGSRSFQGGFVRDDFVVKFAGAGELSTRGRLCEFVTALLAQILEVPAIEPAIVAMPTDVWPSIPMSMRSVVSTPSDPQFASRYLGPGWVTYPRDKQLEKQLLAPALSVYVFDMLIKNVDRRPEKPNVLTNGECIKAYDHELACSFLVPIIGDNSEPWQVQHLEPANHHVFFRSLKGRTLDLQPCIEMLGRLNSDAMSCIRATIPVEWSSTDVDVIESHLSAVRDNADKFAEEIRKVLS